MFPSRSSPMLFVAVAYRESNRTIPDRGTTVSAIIALANVAEIAAIYTLRAAGLPGVEEDPLAKIGLGMALIAVMTAISHRGIVLSDGSDTPVLVPATGDPPYGGS